MYVDLPPRRTPMQTAVLPRTASMRKRRGTPSPIAINVLGVVVERLYDTRSHYLELQTERVEQSVARALLRIMKQAAAKPTRGF